MVRLTLPCILSILAVSACAPRVPETPAPEPNVAGNLPGAGGSIDAPQGSLGGAELCDAANYRLLVGQPHTNTVFPVGPKLRVYSDTALVTQEYLPDRTNVVYDDNTDAILRVFCG